MFKLLEKLVNWFKAIDDEEYEILMNLFSGVLCAGFAFGAFLLALYAWIVESGVIYYVN